MEYIVNPFQANNPSPYSSRTSHKMNKHTQTIRRQFAHELFECIWPFWLRNSYLQKLLQWIFLLHYNSFINRIEILLQFRKLHVRRITPKFQISTWILSTKWMKGTILGAAVHTWKQNFYWIKTKVHYHRFHFYDINHKISSKQFVSNINQFYQKKLPGTK